MRYWLAIAATVLIADQASKYWALLHLEYATPVPVLPVLDWTLLFNRGGAFSMLSDAGGWQIWLFLGASVLAVLFIPWLLGQIRATDYLTGIALSLILGGTLGNLLDRVRLGYVIDFIHFHYQSWYFAAFNLADAAITGGAFLLLWEWFRDWRRSSSGNPPHRGNK